MRKVISTILKIIAVPFTIFGTVVFFQIIRHTIAFSDEHRDDYGSSKEELQQFYKDGTVAYFEDLANSARNL